MQFGFYEFGLPKNEKGLSINLKKKYKKNKWVDLKRARPVILVMYRLNELIHLTCKICGLKWANPTYLIALFLSISSLFLSESSNRMSSNIISKQKYAFLYRIKLNNKIGW